MMSAIDRMREKAARIPVMVPEFVSSARVARMHRNREEVILSADYNRLADYVERATDEECLCVFSDASLRAPLDNEAYRMYMHLSVKVFTSMGVDVPADILRDGGQLDTFTEHILEGYRRKIRGSQQRRTKGRTTGNE